MRRLFEDDDARGVKRDQLKRIRRVLTVLDGARRVEDVDLLPGMRLHRLKGELAEFWSVSVSGNWRIVFQFGDGDAFDVDLVDYH